mgnify:CR=1 FL=1
MAQQPLKELTNAEKKCLIRFLEGYDKYESYMFAYPLSKRYATSIMQDKAELFFSNPRTRHFIEELRECTEIEINLKPLTKTELKCITLLVNGTPRQEAYNKAHQQFKKCKPKTLEAKCVSFFGTERIKHFIELHAKRSKELAANPIEGEFMPHKAKPKSSKYKDRYVQDLRDYLDIDPGFFEPVLDEEGNPKFDLNGNQLYGKYIPNIMPTVAGFARKIRVHRDTLHYWSTQTHSDGTLVYPEFSEVYKSIGSVYEHFLLTNGLMNKANPAVTIFALKNLCGFKDSKELTVQGDQDKPIQVITKEMTPEDASHAYKEMLEKRKGLPKK